MGKIIISSSDAIARAALALQRGGLVAFPTETVYGLGADATSDAAIAAIFAAKGRPSFNPLIVHVADLAAAQQLGKFNDTANRLGECYWPGPMTLVVPLRRDTPITKAVTAGLATIAIRIPAHPIARELLRAGALPIAAPSANRSGHVSPTTAAHVAADLGDHVAMILDGGTCPLGLESTVIDATTDMPIVLRPGGLTREEIADTIMLAPDAAISIHGEQSGAKPHAPGQLASHYAPRAALRLNAKDVRNGEALLAFGKDMPAYSEAMINLSPRGDLTEAAANLFAALRQLDCTNITAIAVMPIPDDGLGHAINDRLTRAAAPRST